MTLKKFSNYRILVIKLLNSCKAARRPFEHLELSTALIIEILAWWAMDMRYISFEPHDIPVELAKKVCMDNIITAYKQ